MRHVGLAFLGLVTTLLLAMLASLIIAISVPSVDPGTISLRPAVILLAYPVAWQGWRTSRRWYIKALLLLCAAIIPLVAWLYVYWVGAGTWRLIEPKRRAVGRGFWVSSGIVILATGLYEVYADTVYLNRIGGFTAVLIGFAAAPVTALALPIYVGLVYDDWSLIVIGMSGMLLAGVLGFIGKKLEGEVEDRPDKQGHIDNVPHSRVTVEGYE